MGKTYFTVPDGSLAHIIKESPNSCRCHHRTAHAHDDAMTMVLVAVVGCWAGPESTDATYPRRRSGIVTGEGASSQRYHTVM